MSFSPKTWKNESGGGTPLSAAALIDLEERLSAYTDTVGSGKQPLDSDLTAIAALSTTTFGRELLTLANAAAGRTALGLGTAATQASTAFDSAGAAAAAESASQPLDSDLTAIAALTTTSYGRALLTAANLAAIIGSGAITESMLESAVKTKLKGAERNPAGFSMPAGTEVKAEQIGQFWQSVASGQTVKLIGMKYTLASGTKAKFSIKQNGTAVTGFKELEAKSSEVQTVSGKEVSVVDGDLFALVVESIEGTPKGISVTLFFESTH